MKKATKLSIAAALSVSALTPAVAFGAEAENAKAGFYNVETGEVVSTAEFIFKSQTEKVRILQDKDFYFADGQGEVVQAGEILTASTDAALLEALFPETELEEAKKVLLTPAGTVTDENGNPISNQTSVDSVSAVNKTTVKVVLNKEVDSVNASNFKIAGATVTAATLAADKKTVTLAVSGLDYSKDYTVTATDILVDGTATDFGSKAFTTPAVTDIWGLEIVTSEDTLKADGSDNLEVTFALISKETGQVDVNADDIVLDLNTTYGTLASKRVTIQNGKATVLLTSEFSNTDITAKIDAQIIEASGDYKDLINHVAGTALVPFITDDGTKIPTIIIKSAEANQADRVTLFFDNEVSLKHFVKTNAKGELLYNIKGGAQEVPAYLIPKNTKPEDISHTFRLAGKSVEVKQGDKNFVVQGFKPVAGNSKAIEVILDKETILKDNADVHVDVVTVNSLNLGTSSSADFKVTDARKPEATSVRVEGLNTLKVKFSEAIADATFQIDGQFKAPTHFTYSFGHFNPVTLEDNRDLATIELTEAYKEAGDNKIEGYFGAGQHTVQVSSTQDFAYATDKNNIGSTQNLTFNITADNAKPTATVTVESPEQFRVKFDKPIKVADLKAVLQLQKYDTETSTFEDDNDVDYIVTKVDGTNNEYVVELIEDWTEIYQTGSTNKNYYNDKYQFVIAKDSVTNIANGLKNEKIVLNLNYAGSPLNAADVTSPVISSIDRVATVSSDFLVTMSEPVKLVVEGQVKDNAGETKAQTQGPLSNTTVQFLGKDKDGKAVTIDGKVLGYADKDDADKVLHIEWNSNADVTPQTVVDAGGSEDWTLVVRSISDDVGNTAASATKDFKIAKSPAGASPFFVDFTGTETNKTYKVIGNGNGDAADTVEITFSEGVQVTGNSDATNPAQYTLNGVTLPTGTSISVENDNSAAFATAEGLEKVIITLPNGTLNLNNNESNVITINKNLVSYDGSVLEGAFELVVNVADGNQNPDPTVDTTALDAAIEAANGLNSEDYTAESWEAVSTAVEAAEALAEDATQAEVDAATQAITDAIDALVEETEGEETVTFGSIDAEQTFTKIDLTNEYNVQFYLSQLDESLQGASYQLILDGETYEFTVSVANPDRFGVRVPATFTEEQIKAAEFKVIK